MVEQRLTAILAADVVGYSRLVGEDEVGTLVRSAAPSGPQDQNPNTGIAKLVIRQNDVGKALHLSVLLSPDADRCANPNLPSPLAGPLSDWV